MILVGYFPRENHEELLPQTNLSQSAGEKQHLQHMTRAREHFSHLDIQKSTGSNGMHPAVLRGLADTTSRLPSPF